MGGGGRRKGVGVVGDEGGLGVGVGGEKGGAGGGKGGGGREVGKGECTREERM